MKKIVAFCNEGLTSDEVSPPESRTSPYRPFSIKELKKATEKWHSKYIVRRGLAYTVYIGWSPDKNEDVAIKWLLRDPTRTSDYVEKAYKSEKEFLQILCHENIVKMRGWCEELNERMIVLEIMENGTLYDCLHDKHNVLSWESRMTIALGAARAIDYIHHADTGPIVHRDIKSTHILIDEVYGAHLTDFRNAVYDPKGGECEKFLGTEPYTAPEYKEDNVLTTKCDIYSFGVVLLELITGREASPKRGVVITEWVLLKAVELLSDWTLIAEAFLDERIYKKAPRNDLINMIKLATDCVRVNPHERPEAAEVVHRLLKRGEIENV